MSLPAKKVISAFGTLFSAGKAVSTPSRDAERRGDPDFLDLPLLPHAGHEG